MLSGNRNFEGRISPDVKMNYLASPPLVIAYALAGTMDFDFETQPLGKDQDGNDVYLKDIWPTNEEVAAVVDGTVSREMFLKDYASVFEGDRRWKGLDVPEGELFAWDENSTYVRKQTFFDGMKATPDQGHPRRPRARTARRLRDHRPHLPGRRVQGLQPGRQIPDRPWRRTEELQLLRFPSR